MKKKKKKKKNKDVNRWNIKKRISTIRRRVREKSRAYSHLHSPR